MSKFEDLVGDFNGMTPGEKLYWMERIIQSFNLREKLDLSKSLRDLISKTVAADTEARCDKAHLYEVTDAWPHSPSVNPAYEGMENVVSLSLDI